MDHQKIYTTVWKTRTKEYIETRRETSHKLITLFLILNSNKHSSSLNPVLLNTAKISSVFRFPSMRLLAFNINRNPPRRCCSSADETLANFPTTLTLAKATQKGTPKTPRATRNPTLPSKFRRDSVS